MAIITLKDVAREAGVSPSTASGALRGKGFVKPKTTRRVLAAATRLGYKVNVSASALRTGRTGVFCLILPNLDIPDYACMANALATELSHDGMRLMVEVSQADPALERRLIGQFTGSMADGMFVVVNNISSDEVKVQANNTPTVLFESYGLRNPLDAVNTPNASAMSIAVRHLSDCGYRRIAVVGRPDTPETPDEIITGKLLRCSRYRAALNALHEQGLDEHMISYSTSWGVNDGILIAHVIAEDGIRSDALLCLNDDLALGVIRGLHECGIHVPEDVAVMGFDGIPEGAHVIPSLSTIAIDFAGMARTAVSLMREQMNDHLCPAMLPRRVSVGFQLLIRESTRPQLAVSAVS